MSPAEARYHLSLWCQMWLLAQMPDPRAVHAWQSLVWNFDVEVWN